jgi:hypothetical protein
MFLDRIPVSVVFLLYKVFDSNVVLLRSSHVNKNVCAVNQHDDIPLNQHDDIPFDTQHSSICDHWLTYCAACDILCDWY